MSLRHRDVAQLGSALPWGGRGRQFKSDRSDPQRNGVANAELGTFAGVQHVTDLDTGRGDDVAALAVLVLDQAPSSLRGVG